MSDQEEFSQQGSGASKTTPAQAGSLKKNGHVILKGHPCKIVEISTSKTGKHGHAKAHIVGIDIFTGKKYEDIAPTSHNMEVPVIKRQELQLIDITSDGFLSLLEEDGLTKDDLKLPEGEIGEKLKEAFESGEKDLSVTIISSMDQEGIASFKEIN